ncbi:P-loop containing nucleoside triphosphate hydrolase protein, partial [Mycena pura]
LPSSPKIFHGRNSELNEIVSILLGDTARVAILGPGGVGKTSLSVAALHCPAIVERYSPRYFVSCESVNTDVDLVSIIGSHLGLEPSRQLSRDIIRHLTEAGPSLLLLDNLETLWEPLESRGGVEEILSLLADVPHLALLVTMRGAERPGKVKWTKPFLPVLEPLSSTNARQMFADIADEPDLEDESALDELLDLSGGLPLAISLLANIASFEGYGGALARWKIENTALLSDGHDKRSNLEKSIGLSLGSPRISSSPPAKNLLSLLSLLPDGITDEDLVASKVPIPQVAYCRSLLVRTSLAYVDVTGRLKALSPNREYIRRSHPPSPVLYRTLGAYFQGLLDVWDSHQLLSSGNLVPRLASYIGNINELMLQSLLHAPSPPTEQESLSANIAIGHSIMKLNTFSRIMLKGNSPLIKILPDLIESTGDSRLRWAYVRQYLRGSMPPVVDVDAERFIGQGVEYFKTVQCPIAEGTRLYILKFSLIH